MKHCIYCHTNYHSSETKCPNCGAVEADNICGNCNTIHRGAYCPNCGFGINETLRVCPTCGYQTKERICPRCGRDIAAETSMQDVAMSVASISACRNGLHNYVGCTCTRCGAVRKEGHNYRQVEGKCEEKCTICGKVKKTPHQWQGNKCSRCGIEKAKVVSFWDSMSTKNRIMGGVLIAVAIVIIVIISTAVSNYIEANSDEIRIPGTSSSFSGRNYQNVEEELRSAGFTNIKTEALGDLIIGFFSKEYSVSKVTVAGKTDYEIDTKFLPDVEIRIYYHSYPEDNTE